MKRLYQFRNVHGCILRAEHMEPVYKKKKVNPYIMSRSYRKKRFTNIESREV